MQLPQTTHPHLATIGQSLGRSLNRHLVANDEVNAAFADLAFEVMVAREATSAEYVGLLEPTL